ncbi:hypothetical protein M433DRAFT_62814 [Acidomyces richmondensis BFW]|nr:MAG: hypothetical protein FE78DRAFT_141175 [Acidomyces sp. 'richmondensis']KYG47548.1 hypothetical protein M433DRAFT_62814 [Acidomyces richmondensis BFW]
MPRPNLQDFSWHKEINGSTFLISTRPSNVDLDFVNTAFESDDIYWAAGSIPREDLQTMLDQSLMLGLYEIFPLAPPPATAPSKNRLRQVGMARIITDQVTVAYLTDVYILPECRNLGLGKWLIKCCNEAIETLPHLRRALLLTSSNVGKRFYSGFGYWDIYEERENVVLMIRRRLQTD